MEHDFAKIRDEALVSPDWLLAHLRTPNLRIVDMRKGEGYSQAHIVGAVTHGGSPFLRENSDVVSSRSFAALMHEIGVNRDTTIIAYDDGNNLFAARLWWVARYYGHTRIKVLDGGWDAWQALSMPTSTVSPVLTAGHFSPAVQPSLIASTEYVHSVLGRPNIQLLDVRGREEWTRTTSEGGSIAGHIPGAHHIVWTDVIEGSTKRFRSGEELRHFFLAAGLKPRAEIIPYCQGGIRAAHAMLALHLAGLGPARNYEGSWGAWSKSGLEIELPAVLPSGEMR